MTPFKEKRDYLSAVLAVALIGFISYNSISERVRIQREIIEKPVERIVYTKDTVTVTQIDTIFQYLGYKDTITLNGDDVVVNERYLFHLAKDNALGNQIRDALPFEDVFGWWREQLGPCGIFEWRDSLYITTFKTEPQDTCAHD